MHNCVCAEVTKVRAVEHLQFYRVLQSFVELLLTFCLYFTHKELAYSNLMVGVGERGTEKKILMNPGTL